MEEDQHFNNNPSSLPLSSSLLTVTTKETTDSAGSAVASSGSIAGAVGVGSVEVLFGEEMQPPRPVEEEGKTEKSSPSSTHLPLFPYHCQICLEDHLVEDGYELSACHHVFCRDCLVAFLTSKVNEAQVYPKCFYRSHQHYFDALTARGGNHGMPSPSPSTRLADQDYHPAASASPVASHPLPLSSSSSSSASPTTSVGYIQQIGEEHFRICNQDISSQDILSLLSHANGEGKGGDNSLVKKYETFKFMRDHKDVRECPFCHHYQITHPHSGPQGNKVICEQCHGVYCYRHANAHDFAQENSCEVYEASLADEEKATVQFIEVTTKPCPNCGVRVMKTAGCNHMKCQCGTAFCWLCGKAIDDDIFPAHFQWWNPGRCSNLQMNEAIEPTFWSLAGARCLTLVQLIFLGPLTLVSTCTSSVLCGYCFYLRSLDKSSQSCRDCLWESFRIQMSFWGIFWMFLLFFIPCFLLLGGIMGSTIAVVAMMCYPFYAISRMARGKYPWPDEVTDCLRAAMAAAGRCLRGCYRACLCDYVQRCLGRLPTNIRWCCCCYCLYPGNAPGIMTASPPSATAESSISTMADESNILRQILEDHLAIQQARSSLSNDGKPSSLPILSPPPRGGDNSATNSRPPMATSMTTTSFTSRKSEDGVDTVDIEKGTVGGKGPAIGSSSSSSFILEVMEEGFPSLTPPKEEVKHEEDGEIIGPSLSGKWFLDVVNTLVDRLEGEVDEQESDELIINDQKKRASEILFPLSGTAVMEEGEV